MNTRRWGWAWICKPQLSEPSEGFNRTRNWGHPTRQLSFVTMLCDVSRTSSSMRNWRRGHLDCRGGTRQAQAGLLEKASDGMRSARLTGRGDRSQTRPATSVTVTGGVAVDQRQLRCADGVRAAARVAGGRRRHARRPHRWPRGRPRPRHRGWRRGPSEGATGCPRWR